ncbi:MAG: hypothetical protein JNM70_18710 [Anaerolineae bacterium]|nr:hypothetical protein [Anaerolineae bacterium]
MPTRILVFNPLADDDVAKIETELDRPLNRGRKIVSSIGGNQEYPVQAWGSTRSIRLLTPFPR